MNLRDYQSSGVDAVLAAWGEAPSCLGVAATGLGKTIIFAHVIHRRREGRALVLAHREELVRQAAEKIEAVTGESPDIEMADHRADMWLRRARIIVASKDSLRGKRLEKFRADEFTTLVTDEAHHAVADSYRSIYDHFCRNPQLRHVGVTATPDRADEEALGQVFKGVAFEYDIQFGIREGWLVPIAQHPVHVEGLDFSRVSTTAGDLNSAELAEVMEQEGPLHGIASATLALAEGRRTLLFAASLRHAELLCDIFNRHEPGQARWISGTTDRDARRQTLRDYAAGGFRYLVNVGVFTEGFDEPGIELVVMARPTKSRSLFAQMVGRGTRPLAGVVDCLASAGDRRAAIGASPKPRLTVLDFVGNSGRHKLITVADILGGNYSDEVVEAAAAEIRGQAVPVNVLDAMEAIEKRLIAARELERRRHVMGAATFRLESVDPFDVFAINPWRERAWHKGRVATEGQVAWMEKAGIPDAKAKTFTQARQLIEEMGKRQKEGKVGYAMATALAARGLPTDMSIGEAMNHLRKDRRAA